MKLSPGVAMVLKGPSFIINSTAVGSGTSIEIHEYHVSEANDAAVVVTFENQPVRVRVPKATALHQHRL